MANNVLTAIWDIASFKDNNLKSYSSTYFNRINAVDEQAEFYIKDLNPARLLEAKLIRFVIK